MTSKPTWSNAPEVFDHVGFFLFLVSRRIHELLMQVVPLSRKRKVMRKDTKPTEAGWQYAAAYAAHYTQCDLPAALQLYMQVIAAHPSAQEAGYSRVQVQNIINTVVPAQELLDAQIELALAHLVHEGPLNVGRVPVTQLATALPT